ncbi:MAG: MGH1-like glycoside hydrolase domain-containing protein [Alphaproteobacteria bacterium]
MSWFRSHTARANDILTYNDRGTYSVPTHGLYPVQFNWDSCFAALGYRHRNPERALSEIILLLSAQWSDGMVPHIVFRGDYDGYFPGPDVWSTGQKIPTSGITQPPVAASVLWRLWDDSAKVDRARMRQAAKRLERWHRWFANSRQDDQGAIFIVHPWESGRDNLTDWDVGMNRVQPDTGLGEYIRRDLEHVNAVQRPTKEEYDRYLTIVHHGRKIGWDQKEMGRSSPFRMVCAGMTAILLAAERDLLLIMSELEMPTANTKRRISRLEDGWRSLWNPKVKSYVNRDLETSWTSNAVTASAFLGAYAGMTDNLGSMMDHFDRISGKVRFMLPSFDPDCEGFDPERYWRGPVWFIINNMVGKGFEKIGESSRAARIKIDTAKLAESSGFYEYFNPITGRGLGGKSFTWTASVYLDWAGRN